ncbi:hypothetical protein ACFY00_11580 [Kitasatospora sp. NPDC001540]|uniref:hypothetical protein n=1 Tax=Kitasatospora sp. NPDC001540 TaxID=3364014 RepID=UPI0036BAB6A1
MDADDLERRYLTGSGWIPLELVERLLERGHGAVVAEQAGRGEWFCARAWARVLAGDGRLEEALGVLAPYAATTWWTAVVEVAGLLEDAGRTEEAIETVRARMALGHPHALEHYARLLARHGRASEAFDLLLPHADERGRINALVEAALAAGREEEAAELLAARIAEHRCTDFPWCCRGFDTDTARGLLAVIRERQGRVDEATALLRQQRTVQVNGRDRLADLLARHGRIDELRAYAADEHFGSATQCLAEVLEARGDVDGAAALYRHPGNPEHWRENHAVLLARLLARHGRAGEAVEELRAYTEAPGNGEDWVVAELCTLYADQGRALDGLAYLDAMRERHRGQEEGWEFFESRLALMAACGRIDEVADLARARPEGSTGYAICSVADLLAASGRAEEALALLGPPPAHRQARAEYLIELDRVGEAVVVLQHTAPPPPPTPTPDLWADTSPL